MNCKKQRMAMLVYLRDFSIRQVFAYFPHFISQKQKFCDGLLTTISEKLFSLLYFAALSMLNSEDWLMKKMDSL